MKKILSVAATAFKNIILFSVLYLEMASFNRSSIVAYLLLFRSRSPLSFCSFFVVDKCSSFLNRVITFQISECVCMVVYLIALWNPSIPLFVRWDASQTFECIFQIEIGNNGENLFLLTPLPLEIPMYVYSK